MQPWICASSIRVYRIPWNRGVRLGPGRLRFESRSSRKIPPLTMSVLPWTRERDRVVVCARSTSIHYLLVDRSNEHQCSLREGTGWRSRDQHVIGPRWMNNTHSTPPCRSLQYMYKFPPLKALPRTDNTELHTLSALRNNSAASRKVHYSLAGGSAEGRWCYSGTWGENVPHDATKTMKMTPAIATLTAKKGRQQYQ